MGTRMKLVTPLRALGAVAFATAIAACGDARSTDVASKDDLQRDLELASATTMSLAGGRVDSALLNTLETKPQGAPQPATTVKKAAGNRAVRSRTPTVRATPEVELAAVEEVAETETLAEAPAPESSEPVAVAPRPAPPVIIATGAGDYGTGGNGGGIFGPGVIIRGGGVDGDNCELHTRGGRRGTNRGPVYVPTIPVYTQPSVPTRTRGGFGGGTASGDTRRSTGTQSQPASPRGRTTSRRPGL